MATEQKPAEGAPVPEATDEPAPAETAEETAAAEAERAAAEADQDKTPADPAEGEKTDDAEKPAEEEGEKKPDEQAAAPKELELARKLRTDANKTMAAARRAQAQVEHVKAENTRLSTENGQYKAFVDELASNPLPALLRLGQISGRWNSVKAFLEFASAAGGGEHREPTADDRVAQLQRRLDEREAAEKARAQEAAVEASRTAVFAAVDKDTDRYDLATTDEGHAELWSAIEAYHAQHGDVPDAAVFLLADEVEKALEAKYSGLKSRKFTVQRQDPKKPGAPAAKPNAARTDGNTISNRATAGAPRTREYSLDPDERRKQVNEDLRAEGLI